jgi:hypothetical protein
VNGGPSRRGGRKPACRPEIVRQMYELHFIGKMSYRQIALLLNTEGIPLPTGGSGWTKSSVVRVMYTTYGQAIGRELGLLAS